MTATFLSVREQGGSGFIQPSLPTLVGDGTLDVLIVTGGEVMPSTHETFAGRRANATGEIGKIIRFVQAIQSLAPQAAVNQIVPLGDQVINRTPRRHATDQAAGMAKGNPAIHATRALLAQFCLVQMKVKFVQSRIRSSAGRSRAIPAKYSMKPLGLPIFIDLFIVSKSAATDARDVFGIVLETPP